MGLAGLAGGAICQQAVAIWKTSKDHRQELQRRIFDARFKTATDVTVTLYANARFFRAWLAAAEEWARGDNRDSFLAARQAVLDTQLQSLTTMVNESERAFALMEFLFPPSIWLIQHDTTVIQGLIAAWQTFEEKRQAMRSELDRQMPPGRSAILREQLEAGSVTPDVHEELRSWITYYESTMSDLRVLLSNLRRLTNAFDVETHRAIQALRGQFELDNH